MPGGRRSGRVFHPFADTDWLDNQRLFWHDFDRGIRREAN
jgi:hypothetical protein